MNKNILQFFNICTFRGRALKRKIKEMSPFKRFFVFESILISIFLIFIFYHSSKMDSIKAMKHFINEVNFEAQTFAYEKLDGFDEIGFETLKDKITSGQGEGFDTVRTIILKWELILREDSLVLAKVSAKCPWDDSEGFSVEDTFSRFSSFRSCIEEDLGKIVMLKHPMIYMPPVEHLEGEVKAKYYMFFGGEISMDSVRTIYRIYTSISKRTTIIDNTVCFFLAMLLIAYFIFFLLKATTERKLCFVVSLSCGTLIGFMVYLKVFNYYTIFHGPIEYIFLFICYVVTTFFFRNRNKKVFVFCQLILALLSIFSVPLFLWFQPRPSLIRIANSLLTLILFVLWGGYGVYKVVTYFVQRIKIKKVSEAQPSKIEKPEEVEPQPPTTEASEVEAKRYKVLIGNYSAKEQPDYEWRTLEELEQLKPKCFIWIDKSTPKICIGKRSFEFPEKTREVLTTVLINLLRRFGQITPNGEIIVKVTGREKSVDPQGLARKRIFFLNKYTKGVLKEYIQPRGKGIYGIDYRIEDKELPYCIILPEWEIH